MSVDLNRVFKCFGNITAVNGVSVKIEEDDGAAGLVFHSDGKDRHYGFYPSSGALRMARFDGPTVYSWNVLENKRSRAWRPGEWNEACARSSTPRASAARAPSSRRATAGRATESRRASFASPSG